MVELVEGVGNGGKGVSNDVGNVGEMPVMAVKMAVKMSVMSIMAAKMPVISLALHAVDS